MPQGLLKKNIRHKVSLKKICHKASSKKIYHKGLSIKRNILIPEGQEEVCGAPPPPTTRSMSTHNPQSLDVLKYTHVDMCCVSVNMLYNLYYKEIDGQVWVTFEF
uniref:Uncharacterized protein n=1 Tax=Arundo donax TaxID=35708 RepID=A0A0A8ZVL4_ARUDO